jgi:hypothetical protein
MDTLDSIFNDTSVIAKEEVQINDCERHWSQMINMYILLPYNEQKYTCKRLCHYFEIILREYSSELDINVESFCKKPDSQWNQYIFNINFNYRKEIPPMMVIKFVRSLVQSFEYNDENELFKPAITMFIMYSELGKKGTFDSFRYKNVCELNNIDTSNALYLISNKIIVNKMNSLVDLIYPERRKEGTNYGNDYINRILLYQIDEMFK